MISDGGTVEGESSAKMKAYIRSIYNVKTKLKKPYSSLSITLSNEDFKGIQTLYDDPVVVSVVIFNFEVQKILVNSECATNILFCKTF